MNPRRPTAQAGRTDPPRLTGDGLQLNGRSRPLISGAVHYWRLERDYWRPALEGLRGLGVEGLETYVPWGIHEQPDGSTDFGRTDPRRDLGAFLALAHELGLWVFLRPGPHINAELTFFGLPRRIVSHEACMARSASGKPVPFIAPPKMFAVPSYASRTFREQTGRWYDAMAQVVRPHLWPDGPVVMLQSDNEAAFYFRDAPYDQDYHPDAIEAFRGFLERRHGSVEQLNSRHGLDYTDWSQVEAPTRMDASSRAQLPLHLDWMAFQEWLICDALTDMADRMRRSLGAELPVVHNLPMGDGGLATSLASVENAVDLVGLDYYHTRDGHTGIRDRTLRLAGSSRHAYAPELGAGAPPWFGKRDAQGDLFTVLCASAYGLRGFNLYMAVERDRWFGSPLGEDGHARPGAAPWRRLLGALHELGFHRMGRRAPVALQIPREYARLTRATHRLGAVSPLLLDLAGHPAGTGSSRERFGFDQPVQINWVRALRLVSGALDRARVPYVYVDSDAPLRDEFDAVIAIGFEYADKARWHALCSFAEGGSKVIYGPKLPELDEYLQPYHHAAPAAQEPVVLGGEREASELVAQLHEELELQEDIHVEPWPLRYTVHEDAAGPRVLFVINPERTPLSAEVKLPGPCELWDPVADERFDADGACIIPMRGRHCRLLWMRGKERPS